MAQITLYLPDEVATRIRREARKARKSVSAYMVDLATRRLTPGRWPEGFSSLCGSFVDLAEPEGRPPDPVDALP